MSMSATVTRTAWPVSSATADPGSGGKRLGFHQGAGSSSEGNTPMFTDQIHPRFSETNAAGHIGFTVLPAWFEQALEGIYRIFMPRLDPQQWTLIVVRFELQCIAEISHTENVQITTHIAKIGNSSLTVVQDLKQGGISKASAETVLVCFDYSAHEAQRIDDTAREALAPHLM